MKKQRLLACAILALLSAPILATRTTIVSGVLSDADIRKILVERIDARRQSVGIVVGVIEPQGRRVVSYGTFAAGEPRAVSADTVFEIGSITKVFTALLLADAVVRGEVSLSDPVQKYLPAHVKVPQRGGQQITLRHLANHTSALPRLPSNLKPADPDNPYADYSVEQLYQSLATEQLTRDIGAQHDYSNLATGLLGHVLVRRAGTDYETLIRTRITLPLGMSSTSIALTREMQARLATGHDETLKPVSNWDIPTLAGAGALRSTANDMLTFLAAVLGYSKSSLAEAMALMTKQRWPIDPGHQVALGWHVFTANGKDVIWHNGGTGGYRSFLGYDSKARAGVIVLSNTGTDAGQDDLGRHLLDPDTPLRGSQ